MKYGEINLGQIEAIINKLGGMEGAERFLSGELAVFDPGSFVRNLATWKTIIVGPDESPEELRAAFKLKNVFLFGYGKEFISVKETTTEYAELRLVVVSPAHLGFRSGVSYASFCMRAKKFGLELLPYATVPKLRLVYDDQPANERLIVGTDTLILGRMHVLAEVNCDSDGIFELTSLWGLNSLEGIPLQPYDKVVMQQLPQ